MLVEPKTWRGARPPHTTLDLRGLDPPKLALRLYENDRIDLLVDQGWLELLERAQREILHAGERRRARRSPSGCEANEGAPELDEYAELVHLQRLERPATGLPTLQPDEPGPAFGLHLGRLLQLALLSRRDSQRPHDERGDDTSDGAVLGPPASHTVSDPLRLLAQYSYVLELERRWRELRQGYVPVQETLGTVRGRITDRGLIQHLSSGLPQLECAYDEFTDAVALFRVLVTALQVIASGDLLSGLGAEASMFGSLTERAIRVRRLLGHIPPLPHMVAVSTASSLHLGRLQRGWQAALDLARGILSMQPPKLVAPTTGACGLMWWVNTDKVWEGVLEQAATRFADKVLRGERILTWDKLPGKDADLLVRWRSDRVAQGEPLRVVIDAKYKAVPQTPEAGDQHQIFAYSARACIDDAPVERAALVYPGEAPERSRRRDRKPLMIPGSRARGKDEGVPFELRLCVIPFPAESELDNWDIYLAGAGESLLSQLAVLPS